MDRIITSNIYFIFINFLNFIDMHIWYADKVSNMIKSIFKSTILTFFYLQIFVGYIKLGGFMKKKMLQFVSLNQATPIKRNTGQRKKDFHEVYKEYIEEKAEEQSSRCSQCGVPFCQVHCPLSNNIPDWLKLTAEGRLQEAYEVSQSTNNMPEVCGRICPQDRLCEGNCVIEQSGHGTVTIGSVEKYITDTAWKKIGLNQ